MDRVCGDNGQASFVGSPGQEVASRPDHMFMSSAFFRQADSVQILSVEHISDNRTMSLSFVVEDAGVLAHAENNCAPGGYG